MPRPAVTPHIGAIAVEPDGLWLFTALGWCQLTHPQKIEHKVTYRGLVGGYEAKVTAQELRLLEALRIHFGTDYDAAAQCVFNQCQEERWALQRIATQTPAPDESDTPNHQPQRQLRLRRLFQAAKPPKEETHEASRSNSTRSIVGKWLTFFRRRPPDHPAW